MDTWLIVVIVVAVVVVLALLALALAKRNKNSPKRQAAAREALEASRLHGARAEHEQAAADESAARARRERAEVEMRATEAEQQAREGAARAEQERSTAEELRRKAEKLSPNVLREQHDRTAQGEHEHGETVQRTEVSQNGRHGSPDAVTRRVEQVTPDERDGGGATRA